MCCNESMLTVFSLSVKGERGYGEYGSVAWIVYSECRNIYK